MSKKKFTWKKAFTLPAFLVVLTASSLTAHAYLKWSALVENRFVTEESATPTIIEDFDTAKNEKTSVKVDTKVTDYSVYVRAAIVAVWVNENGEVHANAPVPGVDYELELNTVNWFEKDGFYYYKTAVAEADTKELIKSCKPLKEAPEDKENPTTDIYTLKVDIVTQTIQSAGMTDGQYDAQGNVSEAPVPPVTAAWGVTVDENKQLTSD